MDDVVVVIETDKVSVDVRAPASGVIVENFGEPDDVVEVAHTSLCLINTQIIRYTTASSSISQ